MADNESTSTSLVLASPDIELKGKDFTGSGKNEYSIILPKEGLWFERQLKAMCLKNGPMAEQSLGNILCAIMYAEEMGLSVILGDLYFVNGRIATTADAKIRHALSSGLIAGYDVKIDKLATTHIKYSLKGKEETWSGPDMHATVTVNVKGWDKPIVYEADLKDWFNGANAAWREHTAFMFRKNCLSKALSEVAPLGVDADEIPQQQQQVMPEGLQAALDAIKGQANQK